MEREVSIVVEIGVTLIALAAVIGIIWFTVFLGTDMANDMSVEASEIVSIEQVGVLNELCNVNNVLPTSGAYSILRTYATYIPNCKCNLHKTPIISNLAENEMPCVLQHMKGKVSLEVIKTDEGWYEVIIHHMNCTWFDGVCNCDTLI